jgi:hypothetical protein
MATAKRVAGKKKGLSIDFTGVESGGGGRLLPEGETFVFEVAEVEQKTSDNSGADYLSFTLKVAEGDYQGAKVWDNMSLQPQALWKLRGFLEAAGFVIDGVVDLDLNELKGLQVSGTVVHEEYQGKKKNRIDAYLLAEDATAEATEEAAEEEAAPAFKKGDAVQFRDGKKLVKGKVTGTAEDGSIVVKVGTDEYEISADELTAV